MLYFLRLRKRNVVRGLISNSESGVSEGFIPYYLCLIRYEAFLNLNQSFARTSWKSPNRVGLSQNLNQILSITGFLLYLPTKDL